MAEARWDWRSVRRVLVVRLRSIGDTVLATPTLHALRRFLPQAEIDVLLEDAIAPLLEASTDVDRVVRLPCRGYAARLRTLRHIRRQQYDVVYNLHGGTTATLFAALSGASHRVGYARYRYGFLHNHAMPAAATFWRKANPHSVDEQLALAGWTGVPVADRPAPRLTAEAPVASLHQRLASVTRGRPLALLHPGAGWRAKRWPARRFGRLAAALDRRGMAVLAIGARDEEALLARVSRAATAPMGCWSDLDLAELPVLVSCAAVVVGNDSGVAHIAAAARVPLVVLFGATDPAHWRPWRGEAAVVLRSPGRQGRPAASVDEVLAGIDRVLEGRVLGSFR